MVAAVDVHRTMNNRLKLMWKTAVPCPAPGLHPAPSGPGGAPVPAPPVPPTVPRPAPPSVLATPELGYVPVSRCGAGGGPGLQALVSSTGELAACWEVGQVGTRVLGY